MRHYWSWNEEECYKKGQRDAEYGRRSWEHDKWSSKPCDIAYFKANRTTNVKNAGEKKKEKWRGWKKKGNKD